ncbi:MAG: tetratricopeptide repeat protein [Rikenellaceae bacterium]|nr:tetratricopeptide repeat protein [Rikenellaceae bacterium]
MKRTIYLMVMLIAALALAIPAQAQKWPERSRVRRGNRAYERLDYGRAEERYQQALELSDTCFEAKFNLGDALYKQQRYDEAEKIFAALAADSTRSDLDRAHSFYNLGNSLFQQKKYQEALSAFKRSLRLNPADLETKYNYAYTKKYIEDNQQSGGGGGDNNQNQDNQNQDQNQQGDGQNDQQNDQNKDQNQQGNDDQNKDQNQDNENNNDQKDQNSDNKEDQSDQNQNDQDRDGDGENDDQQGDNDRDQQGNDDPNEGNQDPNEQGGGQNEPQPSGLSQNDAERMLDAIQGEEDKTRDKVNAKVGQGVVRSGKNW